MLLFLTGLITGAVVGVICMALFTAASNSDRDAKRFFGGTHSTADK